jgi:GT2 family glycosyltransferase
VETVSITSGDGEDASGGRSALEDWLQHIAAYETVRTDDAPTMIAAALMGKQVEYAADGTLGSEAIARYALTEHQVTRLPPRASINPLAPAELDECAKATLARLHAASESPPASTHTVTAVLLTRDRPEFLHRALSSLDGNDAHVRTVVIDNNSAPEAAEAVAALCEARHDTVLNRSERNLGCAGGRRLGAEMADSDFVLFLDDDAELMPGALDHLVLELDRHRGTGAVTATVVQSDATVLHSGGSMETDDAMVMFNLLCIGAPFPSPALPPTGPSGWAPGGALLARRALLRKFPFDDSMGAYFEDNEWSYRVEIAHPDSFRRSREALVLHHVHRRRQPTSFAYRSQVVELLVSYARFYELHGLLLGPWLFYSVPALYAEDGSLDLEAARLLMELVIAKGPDWTFMEWMNGDLDGLLEGHRRLVKLRTLDADVKRLEEEAAHQQDQAARERRLFEARAAQDARAIAGLDARLHDATRRLRRIEESVTWQLFDRFRMRAVALLGGEKSHTVARLQSVLRWTGRHLPPEHRREPFGQPAPDAIGRGRGRRRWRAR